MGGGEIEDTRQDFGFNLWTAALGAKCARCGGDAGSNRGCAQFSQILCVPCFDGCHGPAAVLAAAAKKKAEAAAEPRAEEVPGAPAGEPAAAASAGAPAALPVAGKGQGKGKSGRHSEGTSWWQGTSWSDQRYPAHGSPPPYNATHDREFVGDPMNTNDDDGDRPIQRRRR